MWLILWKKTVFVNICPILLLCTKRVVYNKSKFSSGFAPFQICWKKTKFLSISVLLSEIDSFWLKWVVFSELAQTSFKTTGKHNLAVSASFWGEKQFLLIFAPFFCFVPKVLFTTNTNFPLDFLYFSKLLRKTKFPRISELLAERVTFLTKKRSL